MSDSLRRSYRFAVVPERLIRDKRLSDRAVRMWCLLDRYAGANGEAFPTRETLSKDLDCSRASVDRAITELVTAEWLHKERREAGGSNDYTLLVDPATAAASNPGSEGVSSPMTTPPVITGDETLSSPMTQGVITGDAQKEASLREASVSEISSRPDSVGTASKRDLNEGRGDVDRLCAHLSARLTDLGVKHNPTSKVWRDAARLLLDTDGRTEEQVRNAIDWSTRHHFWHRQILSMPNLRKHYEKLRLDAQAERDAKGRGNVRPLGNRQEGTPEDQARIAGNWGGSRG